MRALTRRATQPIGEDAKDAAAADDTPSAAEKPTLAYAHAIDATPTTVMEAEAEATADAAAKYAADRERIACLYARFRERTTLHPSYHNGLGTGVDNFAQPYSAMTNADVKDEHRMRWCLIDTMGVPSVLAELVMGYAPLNPDRDALVATLITEFAARDRLVEGPIPQAQRALFAGDIIDSPDGHVRRTFDTLHRHATELRTAHLASLAFRAPLSNTYADLWHGIVGVDAVLTLLTRLRERIVPPAATAAADAGTAADSASAPLSAPNLVNRATGQTEQQSAALAELRRFRSVYAYGPPASGKSGLAQYVQTSYSCRHVRVITEDRADDFACFVPGPNETVLITSNLPPAEACIRFARAWRSDMYIVTMSPIAGLDSHLF